MARQTKERVLIDQLSFNFEENIVEHYYKRPKEKELINTTFKKEFSAIKQRVPYSIFNVKMA